VLQALHHTYFIQAKGFRTVVAIRPASAGLVYPPQDWLYGSGVDYYTANKHGLLEIVVLE
jgi:hypothetical protein